MQAHAGVQSSDLRTRFFESVAVDDRGILHGGFSPVMVALPETSDAGKNKNCKGADCGNCKKGCGAALK